MDCSTPGSPVLHYLLEYARAHVHWVSDAIQSSHLLSSISLVAQPRSRHIWVLSLCFHQEPSFVSPLIYRLWTEPRKTKEFAWGLTASGRAWTRSQAASFHWVVHPPPFSSLRESFRARSIKRQKLSFFWCQKLAKIIGPTYIKTIHFPSLPILISIKGLNSYTFI